MTFDRTLYWESQLGKTPALGQVNIEDVAAVAVSLLSLDDTHGWYDLVQGDNCVDDEVEMCVREGIDCFEGKLDCI